MDVQQTNSLQSSSDAHTGLIDEQESPSVDPSFDEKKDSSDIRQRILNSEQEPLSSNSSAIENPQGSHQGQAGPERVELSPSFERYYKTLMIMSLVISLGGLCWALYSFSQEVKPTDLVGLSLVIWLFSILQSIFGYQGLIRKDLGEMNHALNLTKAVLSLIGLCLVLILIRTFIESWKKGTSGDYGFFIYGALAMGLYALLFFLPTKKVIDAFPQGYQERMDEALNADPIKKLNSTIFTLFKYGHLIAFCLGVYWLILRIFQDLTSEDKILERMMSEWLFFISTISGYFNTILPLILISFFVFEGIRRKNLKKLETSKILTIIFLVGFVPLNILAGIALENGNVVWTYEREFMKIFMILSRIWVMSIAIFYKGAWRALEILRDHEKSRHRL